MVYQTALLVADIVLISGSFIALYDSYNERESWATTISLLATLFHLTLGAAIYLIPSIQLMAAGYFGLVGLFLLILLIPGKRNERTLKGNRGYLVGDHKRVDERDIVFARHRLKAGTKEYETYYKSHPESKEFDDKLRETGVLGTSRGIDKSPMNLAMMGASFSIPGMVIPGIFGEPREGMVPPELSPEDATRAVKEFALHLGACSVGVTVLDPQWAYSKRGEIRFNNWEDWGKDIPELPKYALSFCVEMNYEHVQSAPHTPTVAESANGYARGAYISTVLAQWFKNMGYRSVAQHTRNYDIVTTAVAVEAGLGEVGRLGYLITPKQGPRVRVFATLTDMPLLPDKPISFGVEEYCTNCKKCATTCPSKSIPDGAKTIHNGVEKWKLNAETCYEYWSQVGTDCGICMAVCSFGKPDTNLHRIVKWFIKRSPVARKIFPYLDDLMYGKQWKPRTPPKWLEY